MKKKIEIFLLKVFFFFSNSWSEKKSFYNVYINFYKKNKWLIFHKFFFISTFLFFYIHYTVKLPESFINAFLTAIGATAALDFLLLEIFFICYSFYKKESFYEKIIFRLFRFVIVLFIFVAL